MKKLCFLLSAAALCTNAYAQKKSNLKYSDEGFNTQKVESTYTPRTAGQQFTQRLDVLYKQSEATSYKRITRTQYSEFLQTFQNLISRQGSNATIAKNLGTLSAILNSINDFAYNNDDYRNSMYHTIFPVYKAVTEEWGAEIVNVAIYNAYFQLREYVAQKSNDDSAMAMTLQLIDNNPINNQTGQTCNYKIWVDPKIAKEDVEIYITDPALYSVASKRYPEGQLLAGPIVGWENSVDESAGIRGMLKSYAAMPKHAGYNVYDYTLTADTKNTTLEQPLYKDNKWFMWVFRKGKLYYTYMAEPCSAINNAQIK